MIVQVKNGVMLFWRETKLYRTDCIVPQPHSSQNAGTEQYTHGPWTDCISKYLLVEEDTGSGYFLSH